MNINIIFKDKTIVIDDYGCICNDILPLEDNWVSLHIEDNDITLYVVGGFRKLDSYDFAESWISYNQEHKKEHKLVLLNNNMQKEETLNQIKLNEDLELVSKDIRQKEQEEYLLEVEKARLVDEKIQQNARLLEEGDYNG